MAPVTDSFLSCLPFILLIFNFIFKRGELCMIIISHTAQLEGSQFPDPGLNPGRGSESLESLVHRGTPRFTLKESQVQRGAVTSPRSHSQEVWDLGARPELLAEVKVKLLSRVRLFVTPWTVAHQAPPSMGFSRPFPSQGDLPDPGIEPGSPALQADALTSEPPGKQRWWV